MNPLSSRLLQFRYFSDRRLETYYRRTLNDRALADRWSAHYLGGLPIAPGALVLDHGCGRGRHTALLSQLGFDVCAQDVARHAWWGSLQARFQTVPPNATKLPWADRVFSLMLDVEVLHYANEAQLEQFAREAFRVLAPGAFWVTLEANDRGYGAFLPKRFMGRLHSLARVRDLATRAGFAEVDVRYEGFYAPFLPRLVDFARKQGWPGPLDVSDFGSWLESKTPDERRALWCLRLQKPA